MQVYFAFWTPERGGDLHHSLGRHTYPNIKKNTIGRMNNVISCSVYVNNVNTVLTDNGETRVKWTTCQISYWGPRFRSLAMFSDCLISHTAFPSEVPHPPPSASEFNNTGTVVGVIFAVVVMAILAIVLVIIMKGRQDKRRTLYRSKCSTASCFSSAVYLSSLEATYEKSTIV